jgi:hypothetical protein
MTTKPITGYRIKDGKVVKAKPSLPAGQAKNKAMKSQRLAKAWAEKSR